MVDNIKPNKILPSLSPARKVKRAEARGRNNQQTPFKESLERKQKKKKKDNPEKVMGPEPEFSLSTVPRERLADEKGADRCSRPGEPARSRLIDIRV
ncbi:hypothetical protein D1BOALGB6SA_4459 [Olavius sp. associated proteobacterium Delta 1]|nr:hypothetical protein D1BOALGB6SA_4459 [Olavius sp. associated proteobacterium Delta 1]